MSQQYLIRKGGFYYRPNSQGYTTDVRDAGRYSFEDAAVLVGPNGPDGSQDNLSMVPDTYPDFVGFTKAIMQDWQEHCDIDGADTFELALRFNILLEIPGGFDPENHVDNYGEAEPGDPWYEANFS